MREIFIEIGKLMFEDRWAVNLSNKTQTCQLRCAPNEWTKPFYGKRLDEQEIQEMIEFLQNTLKEQESDEESNME